MIAGVGIDLVSVGQLAGNLQHKAFIQRVFTPAEIVDCERFSNSTERFAGKFAAKEALMKAIGKGIRQEVWFSQIEVLNRENGAPYLQASGEAEKALSALGVEKVHVSISHTAGMAVALVLLERV